MKHRAGPAGFTIVEVMIVLAVTGALFVAIAATLAGRQESNEFTQSIQDVRAQIQQVVTEVQNGYSANYGDVSCTASAAGTVLSPVTAGVGTNGTCIFLGKVLQFGANSNNGQILIYPIAGYRDAPDVPSAKGVPLASASSNDLTTYNLEYGLQIVSMTAGGTNIGAFGILSSPGATGGGATPDGNQFGNQVIDTYALKGTTIGGANPVQTIASSLLISSDFVKNPSGGIQICFQSGGTKQSGLITVGQNNSQLAVNLSIKNSTDCS